MNAPLEILITRRTGRCIGRGLLASPPTIRVQRAPVCPIDVDPLSRSVRYPFSVRSSLAAADRGRLVTVLLRRILCGYISGTGDIVRPGKSAGMDGANAARPSGTTPVARENARPYRLSFSNRITPERTTTTGTFMAPTATTTTISPQQCPTHEGPSYRAMVTSPGQSEEAGGQA